MRIATIAFESSSLSGWPVEVGWMREGDAAPRSMLVRPDASWSMDEWTEIAEEIHGITKDDLARDGVGVRAVYDAMVADLAGCVVVSDAPGSDQRWLERLCDAAGRPQPFELSDVSRAIGLVVGGDECVRQEAFNRYRAAAPKLWHRAGPDAEQMYRALFDIAPE